MVVAALPMRLFSSECRDRVSEIVEPKYRYTKSCKNSSLCSKIVMFGGESTSWAVTYVFFRLIFCSKSWYALLKRLMTFWRSSVEWAVMAASLESRRSRRYFIWTLDFAISLGRLRSFRLTWSGGRYPLLHLQRLVSAGKQRKSQLRSWRGRTPASLHFECWRGLMLNRERPQCPSSRRGKM